MTSVCFLSLFGLLVAVTAIQQEAKLLCGETGAWGICDESQVELAEEEVTKQMQVELLQHTSLSTSPEAEALQAMLKHKSCAVDHLVGNWKVENALGIDGVTVALQVAARSGSECLTVTGNVQYLGKETEYTIFATDGKDGKLHVKYLNDKATPSYYHEGHFDLAHDVLIEDLGSVNGEKKNEGMVLQFKRSL